MGKMKVARWGNSLAVRLPHKLVRELDLKEGDMIDFDRDVAVQKYPRRMSREEAIQIMKASRWELPEGFRFDREEANAR